MIFKNILKKDFSNSGNLTSAEIDKYTEKAKLIYFDLSKKKLLDVDFLTQFQSADEYGLKNSSDFLKVKESFERKSDRLTELAYTNFLINNNFKLGHVVGNHGLDIKLNNINGWGEYKNIRLGNAGPEENYLISRITNGLNKKFIDVEKYRNEKYKVYSVKNEQPVILFFEYSKKLVDTYLPILIKDRTSETLPIEFRALFPINNTDLTEENELIIKNNNGKSIKIPKRYFVDYSNVLTDNKVNHVCDFSQISAVVFSETITNSIFIDEWDNDLIMIHNPMAKNPVKEKLFPTKWEYKVEFDKNTKFYNIKEIHDKIKQ